MSKALVTSVDEFIHEIKNFGKKFVFYRGERCAYLTPLVSCALRDDSIDITEICMELHRQVFSLLTTNEYTHILAFAQHHGLPTNLLDVTTNPLVALFFACHQKDKKESDGYVYCFEETTADITAVVNAGFFNVLECCKYPFIIPEEDRRVSLEKNMKQFIKSSNPSSNNDPFSYYAKATINQSEVDKMPRTMYKPLLSFGRAVAQKSCFIYQWFYQENDTTYKQIIKPDGVITVSNDHKSKILEELDIFGINEATIFGDYDSIARYVTRKHTQKHIKEKGSST